MRQDLHPVRRPHHRRGPHRRSHPGNPHALHDPREGIANMSALRESLGFLTSRLRQVGIFVALILIVILFQVLTD
ncbi:MAG: sugar ABC transporter permease, partial [Paenarthrobacter sp.]